MFNTVCITPTKNRPQQLATVIDCMNKQTVKPDLWVIADDGKQAQHLMSNVSIPFKYIGHDSPFQPSGAYNCVRAIQQAPASMYIIIEDDDYYPATYVQYILSLPVVQNTMCGDGQWIDYKLDSCHFRVNDSKMQGQEVITKGSTFAPWHGTFFKGQKIRNTMLQLLDKYKAFPDFDWRIVNSLRASGIPGTLYNFHEHSCISLKGYNCGLPGVTRQHRDPRGMTKDDTNFSFFKTHVPDWQLYSKFLGTAY